MNHKEPAQMNSTPSPLWTFVSVVVNPLGFCLRTA